MRSVDVPGLDLTRLDSRNPLPISNCILDLPMEEGSGNTLTDRSASGNNGTKVSNILWNLGVKGRGLSRSTGEGAITLDSVITNISGISWSLWIKTNLSEIQYSDCLFWTGNYYNDGYGLFIGGDPSPRDVRLAILIVGVGWYWLPGSGWQKDFWNHIVLTIEEYSATRIVSKLYINNNYIGLSNKPNPTTPTTGTYLCASEGDPPDDDFGASQNSGWMDQVKVFDKVLSEIEIAWLFRNRE